MKDLKSSVINEKELLVAPLMGFPGLQLVDADIKTAQQNHLLHFEVISALYDRFKPDIMFPMMDLSLEANALGRETKFPVNEPATILKQAFTEKDFLKMQKIDITQDARIRSYTDTVRLLSAKLPGSVFKAAYVSGPFTLAALIKGADDTAMATMIDPQNLHELIAFCTEKIQKFAEALMDAGADMICILEPTASLLSPALFEEFSGKYIEKISADCKKRNVISVLHVCGNTMPFMSVFAKTDVDGFSLDSAEAGVDLDQAAKQIPENKLIIGNICPTGKILTGKPEEVEEEVRKLIMSMKKHKNFVLSTGCDLPQNVPLENIEAFMKAGRK